MNKALKISLLGAILYAANSHAIDIVPSSSGYYYKLGGGSDVSMPPVTRRHNVSIGGDINTGLNYTCTGFNPAISIKDTFNDMKGSVEGIDQDVASSATSAIGTLPMFFLKKANPDLYNIIQNTITHAMDKFHLGMKNCQDGLSDIRKGKSPYQDWFSISDSQGWLEASKRAKQGQDVDINGAQKEITKDPRKYGVPWVHKGENSGGSNGSQVPIRVIRDVVVAGYNVMLDPKRHLDDSSPAPSDSDLFTYWQTPNEAGDWAQLVLGDITISSKESTDETSAGVGLVTLIKNCPDKANNDLTCAKSISGKLKNIVEVQGYPSAKELKSVSSSEMLISPDVISAIRNMTNQDKAVTISKISQDVALQNLVDQSLMFRRLLLAGSQTKPVHNLQPALTSVQSVIKDLDDDIKNLLFEHDIKKKMITGTLKTVLEHERASKLRAISSNEQTQTPETDNGAIYKKGD